MEVSSVDDDRRKRKRRSIYSNVDDGVSNTSSNNSKMEIKQIKRRIDMCRKLFMENKITIRNAWNLKIIDYINAYISSNLIEPETLLVAAAALDICIKVYSCKVEYIGNEVEKLVANNISTIRNTESIPSSKPLNISHKRNKSRKIQRTLKITLVADTKNLVVEKVPQVLPSHFIQSADIYSDNYEKLFTMKTPMDHCGYQFELLNNAEHGFISYGNRDQMVQRNLLPTVTLNIESVLICPEFSDFDVNEDNCDGNDSFDGILNENSQINNDEVEFDESGIAYLDDFMDNMFADDAHPIDYNISENNDVVNHSIGERIVNVTSFCPINESVQIENHGEVLSNRFLETVWMGPSHWKNKRLRPSESRFSGKSNEKVVHHRKKRRISAEEVLPLSFSNDIEEISRDQIRAKPIRYNINRYTLPLNRMDSLPDFDKMMLNLTPVKVYHFNQDQSGPAHTYDSSDTCQYNSNEDNHQDDSVHENNEQSAIPNYIDEEISCIKESTPVNSEVVPDNVTETYIPYAHRVKRININRLKKTILKSLTNDINANCIDIHNIKPTAFTELYKQLLSELSDTMRDKVNVPIVFFALLYVATECGLNISGSANLNEAVIRSP